MTIQINGTLGISGVDGSAATPSLQGSDPNTGVFFGTDEVKISTNGTQRATVDSSGRLLVGTSTAPSIDPGDNASLVVQGQPGAASAGAHLSLQRGEAPTAITAGEGLGAVVFAANDGSTFAQIAGVADATAGSGDYPGRLVFSTTADSASSPTERMRIQNTGYVNIQQRLTVGELAGTFSPGEGAFIVSYAGGSSLNYAAVLARDTSDNDYVWRGVVAGVIKSEIQADGSFHSAVNSFTSTSDARLKENIVDASSQWDDIKTIKVRNFNYTQESGQDTFRQLGVIAQELEVVCPGLVVTNTDKDLEGNDLGTVTKSVKYSVLYMKAVKALQEAMERIETLEAEVAILKGGTN